MASAGRERENTDRYKCEHGEIPNTPTGKDSRTMYTYVWVCEHAQTHTDVQMHSCMCPYKCSQTKTCFFFSCPLISHKGNPAASWYQWRSFYSTDAALTILASIWNRPRVRWGLNCVGTRPRVSNSTRPAHLLFTMPDEQPSSLH